MVNVSINACCDSLLKFYIIEASQHVKYYKIIYQKQEKLLQRYPAFRPRTRDGTRIPPPPFFRGTGGMARVQAQRLIPGSWRGAFPFRAGWSDRDGRSAFGAGRAWEKTGSRLIPRNTPIPRSNSPRPGPEPKVAVRENPACRHVIKEILDKTVV
jgi:hypothetical protein